MPLVHPARRLVSNYSYDSYYWRLHGLPTLAMTDCYRQGRGQDDPQSEKDDQPESDHAFVFIPVILATLAFFAANEAFRVGREISVFREDAFHGAVALSRREFERKIVGLQKKMWLLWSNGRLKKIRTAIVEANMPEPGNRNIVAPAQ